MARIPKQTAVFLMLALPVAALAADWPRFRGPQADGISPETGINKNWTVQPPEVLWKIALGDRGFAGPSVNGGKVFLIDHEGDQDVVRALDLRTGSNVWTYAYADSNQENYGFARSTPTIDEGRVYCLSRVGLLNCLDEKTGKLIWSTNIITAFEGRLPKWQLASSPFVDGDRLVLLAGGKDASVVVLKKANGQLVWKGGGSDLPGYATPVVATINGRKQYVIFTALRLIGVDAAEGRELWQVPWRTSYDVNAATPVVVDNRILITSGYGHGCAVVTVTGNTASITWESKELTAHFNSPVYRDGFIYGIGDPGNLVCLEFESGKLRWKQGGFEKGGIVVVEGTIISLAGNNGQITLAELTPQKYVELGKIQPLDGRSWTAPIVAGGRLIVRNQQSLACLNLQAAKDR